MDIKDKKILVFGFGLTGISALVALKDSWDNTWVYNDGPVEDVKAKLSENRITGVRILDDLDHLTIFDLIIKSPGIKPNHTLLIKAMEYSIPVISDIEFGFNILNKNKFYCITGTNGKTTSTVLANNIFKRWDNNTHMAGNVGVGLLSEISKASDDDIFLLELSSFQLEHTINFKPNGALILNISPDHIDWHGSLENYIKSKYKIFKNQDKDDYLVLNYDDDNLRSLKGQTKTNEIFFSQNEILEKGIFLKDRIIVYKDENKEVDILNIDNIRLPGKHNLENIMGVIGLSFAAGVPLEIIRDEISKFQGVEHRIEFVKNIRGVNYYNDSKGTNIESTLKAIEALEKPLILIAGGYDKGSSFEELIIEFNKNGKALIVFGATKDKFVEAAKKVGFVNIHVVNNLDEAVNLSYLMAEDKDTVLLSPACASWDMYTNFEQRGNHFKELVSKLSE